MLFGLAFKVGLELKMGCVSGLIGSKIWHRDGNENMCRHLRILSLHAWSTSSYALACM